MNPKQLEQLLLLEQSGELAPAQRRALAAELAASPDARRFRDQLRALAAAVPPPAAGPAPDAAARIAARLQRNRKSLLAFRPVWKPALAAAAALALLLGIQTFRPAPAPAPVVAAAVANADEEWTDPLDADFTELEELLYAIAADESFEISEL
ncbi:MAG: hypothetical protein EOL90_11755 [Spartobacteria bacterium]|nr:hypothetical protein [Spartobacteria bacterium]